MNKLFSEIAPTIVYPEEIPDALQIALYNWYQFREIADNDKFSAWFIRHLTKDYDRYSQILRIEAGVSTYDWLVQNYREYQGYTHDIGETTGTTGATVTTSGTVNRTTGGTVTTTHDGTVTDARTDSHTLTRDMETSGKVERTPNLTDTETDTRSRTTSGGYKDNTTYTPGVSETTDTQTVDNDDSTRNVIGWDTVNRKRLEKSNPMSISYTTGISEPVAGSTADGSGATSGGALDWTSPSAQAADMGRDGHGETVTDHTGHTQVTRIRDGEDISETERTYVDYKEQSGGSLTTTRTGLEQTVSSGTSETSDTYNGTGGNTRTLDTTDTRTTSGTGTDTTAGTQETTGTSGATSEMERLHQQIYTGRSDDIATLLQRAANYIMTTDAFDWLRRQLDVCFIGVYNV